MDKSRLEDIKQGEMKVFPYREIDISDTFSLASLEGILKGEAVIVDYFHLD